MNPNQKTDKTPKCEEDTRSMANQYYAATGRRIRQIDLLWFKLFIEAKMRGKKLIMIGRRKRKNVAFHEENKDS